MALIYEVYKCTDIDSFLESLEIAEKHFTCMYIYSGIYVPTYLPAQISWCKLPPGI